MSALTLRESDLANCYNIRYFAEKEANTNLDYVEPRFSESMFGLATRSTAMVFGIIGLGASSLNSHGDDYDLIVTSIDAATARFERASEYPAHGTLEKTLQWESIIYGTLAGLTGDIGEDDKTRLLLKDAIQRYGIVAVGALEKWLDANSSRHAIVAVVMRFLGQLDDSTTKSSRLNLLAKGLTSGSPLIRDSAALGLEDLNDKRAIPLLQAAIETEPYSSLRQDYLSIVQSLGS